MQVSLQRVLTLFVILLSSASVCAAPRRQLVYNVSMYNSEIDNSNSVQSYPYSSPPVVAITSDNSQSQAGSLEAEHKAAPSVETPSLQTGTEPFPNAYSVPRLDSMRLSGPFPTYMSHRVAFSAERPKTPPLPLELPPEKEFGAENRGEVMRRITDNGDRLAIGHSMRCARARVHGCRRAGERTCLGIMSLFSRR